MGYGEGGGNEERRLRFDCRRREQAWVGRSGYLLGLVPPRLTLVWGKPVRPACRSLPRSCGGSVERIQKQSPCQSSRRGARKSLTAFAHGSCSMKRRSALFRSSSPIV